MPLIRCAGVSEDKAPICGKTAFILPIGNAAMQLGGMGPVTPLTTRGGKLFAGAFALYAGLVFVACAALVLTPLFHCVLHHFHISDKG